MVIVVINNKLESFVLVPSLILLYYIKPEESIHVYVLHVTLKKKSIIVSMSVGIVFIVV